MTVPPYVHCLTLPTPFPIGPVNVYLVEGDPLTLIDTGPKAAASLASLEAGLAEHGYRVEDLRRIIVTHHHVDHMGLASAIVARSGAEIWTHPYNFPWLADYVGEHARHQPFFRQIWREGGVPVGIVQAIDGAGQNMEEAQESVEATGRLDEGQTITLGGEAWHVYHTPGHAGGLICLWEPGSATLLANDHLLLNVSSNPVLEPSLTLGPRPKRLVQYLCHLQRMGALRPAIALTGHGEPVTDVAGLVRQRVSFHARRAQKIYDTIGDQAPTLWDLTLPIFPRLQRGMDFFLALSEILGHLDLLEQDGRLRSVMEAGLVRWQRL